LAFLNLLSSGLDRLFALAFGCQFSVRAQAGGGGQLGLAQLQVRGRLLALML